MHRLIDDDGAIDEGIFVVMLGVIAVSVIVLALLAISIGHP